MTTRALTSLAMLMLVASIVGAAPPAPKGDDRIAAAARRAWAITDLVLEHDIDPPARQQMLLDGTRALLRQARGRKVNDLSARASAVTALEQFAVLLAEVWPDGDDTEDVLFHNLIRGPEKRFGERGYLSARERKAHEAIAGNRYVGTGIQIRIDSATKLTQIVVPFPGGPARKAGARPGDLIVAVNEQSMKGLPLTEVVRRLQGEEGTEVSMTVRQPNESKTRRLAMVRSVIPFASVQGHRRIGEESWDFRVNPKAAIGYLSVNDIKSSTLQELRQIEPLLRKEGVRAVVLDLRFARGTDIAQAARTADGLLDGGMLWHVRDARGRVKEYKADRDCIFREVPLAVLIGRQTGGTAAAVAAALQDRGRAVLVGEPAGGEMLVSSLIPLPSGEGALLLHTGWVERLGRKHKSEHPQEPGSAGPVVPDHRIEWERKQMETVLEWRHQQESPEPKADARPPDDPQLAKAVSLLTEALARSDKKDAP